MAKKNAFLKISSSLLSSFFSKEIIMYACMDEMQTHFNKERNKHILYLHIIHNKPKLSNDISTLISSTHIFNGEFLFLGLLTWFRLLTGDNKTDVCKKLSRRLKQVVNPLNKAEVHFNGPKWA